MHSRTDIFANNISAKPWPSMRVFCLAAGVLLLLSQPVEHCQGNVPHLQVLHPLTRCRMQNVGVAVPGLPFGILQQQHRTQAVNKTWDDIIIMNSSSLSQRHLAGVVYRLRLPACEAGRCLIRTEVQVPVRGPSKHALGSLEYPVIGLAAMDTAGVLSPVPGLGDNGKDNLAGVFKCFTAWISCFKPVKEFYVTDENMKLC